MNLPKSVTSTPFKNKRIFLNKQYFIINKINIVHSWVTFTLWKILRNLEIIRKKNFTRQFW